ncbi:unnamed protein product [Bursaphelenchus okinawaensis]|uniref:Uncharacterized protein n=1 Tax=Bursaphelenchus okinawaensis TaxID=465554 RepID=A0A811LNC5_9BILA|nr:unnamed protein product [Bursaphelenchus okinawaensis]CAG9127037.1 unnamed protein product [Bursaphelenchus okinawaensis]
MHTWCWVLFVTLSVAHEDKRLKESAQLLFEFHKWWKKAAEQIRATVNETGRKIDPSLPKSVLKAFKEFGQLICSFK